MEFLRGLRRDLPTRFHGPVDGLLQRLTSGHRIPLNQTMASLAPSTAATAEITGAATSAINSCAMEQSTPFIPSQIQIPLFSATTVSGAPIVTGSINAHRAESVAAKPSMAIDRPPNNHLPLHFRFDFVHLSVLDERWLTDFVNIMHSSTSRDDLYDKFRWAFHIVCVDFGAQLFLQRPKQLLSVCALICSIN